MQCRSFANSALHNSLLCTAFNMSQSTCRAIPATRRVILNDSSQLPSDYSTTPGGTLFSTTPGGKQLHLQSKLSIYILRATHISIYILCAWFAILWFLNNCQHPKFAIKMSKSNMAATRGRDRVRNHAVMLWPWAWPCHVPFVLNSAGAVNTARAL